MFLGDVGHMHYLNGISDTGNNSDPIVMLYHNTFVVIEQIAQSFPKYETDFTFIHVYLPSVLIACTTCRTDLETLPLKSTRVLSLNEHQKCELKKESATVPASCCDTG